MSDERENETGVDGSTHLLASEKKDEAVENECKESDGADEKLVSGDGKFKSNSEASEVKFFTADSQNGDAKIDIENVKNAFAGMGKEELMKFANDPFWIRTRWILFIFFWALWVAMLLGAVAIIVLAPKCAAPAPLKWWEESPIYEVNVRSFKDGDNQDGIGDLNGLKSQIKYIENLGVKGLILSSVLKSSHKLHDGYTVDFLETDPLVGTVEEFANLTAILKEKGIHVILDFIPNHTSMKHPWFKSSELKEEPYTNYYIWKPPKVDSTGERSPPNNWVRVGGNQSAWSYNEKRGEYYLHQFHPDQPDLNFRNNAVVAEFKKFMKFWLDKGVSGFQLSNVEYLLEDDSLSDEEISGSSHGGSLGDYSFYTHSKTANLPEGLNKFQEFREFMLNVSADSVLAVSSNVTQHGRLIRDPNMTRPFDIVRNSGMFTPLERDFTAHDLYHIINNTVREAHEDYRIFWELGNSQLSRLASRLSPDVVDGLNAVIMLLPGTPITFYGDELAMADSDDPERKSCALMSWKNNTGAGFSSHEDTSALSANYEEYNVETEERNEDSHLNIYKKLSGKARTARSIMFGTFESTVYNGTVYAYTRLKSGNPGYLVAFNPSDYDISANLKESFKGLADDLKLIVKSPHMETKEKYVASNLQIPAKGMAVFTFVPQQD